MLAVVVLVPLAVFEALVPLPQAAVLFAHVRSAARRLFALLDAEPAVTEPSVPLPPPPRRTTCGCATSASGGPTTSPSCSTGCP